MARSFKQLELGKDYNRTDMFEVLPEKVRVDADLNGRHDAPELVWLRASIRAEGQITPCTVRDDGGELVLVEGHNRYIILCELNEERRKTSEPLVRMKCTFAKCNEQEGFVRNLMNNHFRHSLTLMDYAHCFERMTRWAMSPEQIAERLNSGLPETTAGAITIKFVNDCLTLYAATPELQHAIAEGRVKPTATMRLAKLTAKQQREAVQGEGRITTVAVAQAAGQRIRPSLKSLRDMLCQARDDTTKSHEVRAFAALVVLVIEGEEKEL